MRIVLATDGSDDAQAAAGLLARLPLPADTRVDLVTVMDELKVFAFADADSAVINEIRESFEQKNRSILERESARLADTGWQIESSMRQGYIAEEILAVASAADAELVVIGSRGLSGLERFFLGSVSQKIMKYAPHSVLIVRPVGGAPAAAGPPHLMVAVDGSYSSDRAVAEVAALAKGGPLRLTVVTAVHAPDDLEAPGASERLARDRAAAEAELERSAAQLQRASGGDVDTVLREGAVAHELLEAATELAPDIVVVGHKGKGAVERFLLGSVSNRLVHYATCAVWVVRN